MLAEVSDLDDIRITRILSRICKYARVYGNGINYNENRYSGPQILHNGVCSQAKLRNATE